MKKLKIIVGGYIGLYPTGGATWDYIQYPVGLKMLGHDVYYVEDTRQYPLFQSDGKDWNDASGCIQYLKKMMEAFGLKDKWAYRDIASGQCYGMTKEKVIELCRSADVFINISCSTFLREEYLNIPKRVLIDSDPMFTQVQYESESGGDIPAEGPTTRHMLENHNFLFSFGENIGAEDCKIPLLGFKWHATRQPVCLNLWESKQKHAVDSFSSIMNWSGRKKMHFNNEEWGQKDIEFEKYKSVPSKMPGVKFKVVINKPLNKDSNFDSDGLETLGWSILAPDITIGNTEDYKSFIINSAAEFSVAKETYVKSKSGWFSGRSACYLAGGKPVITQETQWSKFIPAGNGLFAFTDVPSAVDAINEVNSRLAYHSRKAKEIAREYFDSAIVLTDMINKLN